MEYARLVLKFDRTEDISAVDLRGVLSQRIVIVLSTTAAFTTGKLLSDEEFEIAFNISRVILDMDSVRTKVHFLVS